MMTSWNKKLPSFAECSLQKKAKHTINYYVSLETGRVECSIKIPSQNGSVESTELKRRIV